MLEVMTSALLVGKAIRILHAQLFFICRTKADSVSHQSLIVKLVYCLDQKESVATLKLAS